MNIDAFGKQCPLPLMMAKKELDAGCRDLSISVDNNTAVENLTRLGKGAGLSVDVSPIEGGFLVTLCDKDGASDEKVGQEAGIAEQQASADSKSKKADKPFIPQPEEGQISSGYVVFIGKDHVGEGDQELGYNLMKMALFTLSESSDTPEALLFMNTGVKLLTGDNQQITEHVRSLAEKGSEVLVCGTCLDFYGVKADLQVGDVSNMYDILGRMQKSAKVITL